MAMAIGATKRVSADGVGRVTTPFMEWLYEDLSEVYLAMGTALREDELGKEVTGDRW
jgi:hypothetical protein